MLPMLLVIGVICGLIMLQPNMSMAVIVGLMGYALLFAGGADVKQMLLLGVLLVALFYAVFTPVSTWWGHALTTAGWNDFLVLAGTMVANFVTEFLYQRFVVYRNCIDTNDVARRASKKAGVEP